MRFPLASFRIVCLALLAVTALEAPASAQGLFNSFGGRSDDRYPSQNSWFGRQERREIPPQASAYSDPYSSPAPQHSGTVVSSGSTGRYVAYCVRLCDGRYFPMQRHANASPVQLCNAFCPASKTQVFNGTQIDHAVAQGGARYADLDNAFVYREKIVSDCTCNGKNAFGLARIDVASDPTLRPGDIVSNGDNVKAAMAANAAKLARNVEPPALRGSSNRTAKAAIPAETAADTDERPED